jgi:hypothetical protein
MVTAVYNVMATLRRLDFGVFRVNASAISMPSRKIAHRSVQRRSQDKK